MKIIVIITIVVIVVFVVVVAAFVNNIHSCGSLKLHSLLLSN